jgi:hypothetical protein
MEADRCDWHDALLSHVQTDTDQLDRGWNQMGHSDRSVFVSWSTVPNYFVRRIEVLGSDFLFHV